MTVSSGVGGRGFLDEYNLSDNVTSIARLEASSDQLVKTVLSDEAQRRLPGRNQGFLQLMSNFDDATGKSHDALTDFPASSANRILTYLHRATRGAVGISIYGLQQQLAYVVSENGDLNLNASLVGNGFGLEMGHTLTAGLETSTGAESLAGVDDGAGAATDFGLQAYLHVTAFTGTSVDISIEDSDDNGSGDAYAAVPGAAFTTVTGPTFERIQTSRTTNVKEWLRVDLSGTYTNLALVVVVIPNRLAAVNF